MTSDTFLFCFSMYVAWVEKKTCFCLLNVSVTKYLAVAYTIIMFLIFKKDTCRQPLMIAIVFAVTTQNQLLVNCP